MLLFSTVVRIIRPFCRILSWLPVCHLAFHRTVELRAQTDWNRQFFYFQISRKSHHSLHKSIHHAEVLFLSFNIGSENIYYNAPEQLPIDLFIQTIVHNDLSPHIPDDDKNISIKAKMLYPLKTPTIITIVLKRITSLRSLLYITIYRSTDYSFFYVLFCIRMAQMAELRSNIIIFWRT